MASGNELDDDAQVSYLIYDGECPFCTTYVHKILTFRKRHGDLKLISARESDHPLVREALEKYDLDYGFIFIFRGKTYYGAEAMHLLSALSEPQSYSQKFAALIFRNRFAAKIVYPVLAFMRRLYFRLVGKPLIADDIKSKSSAAAAQADG